MMCKIIFNYIAFIAFAGISYAATPPFITKCKLDDRKCLKESTQAAVSIFVNGLPENKVDSLDPLIFDEVDGSSENLSFILSNVSITGLKQCQAKTVQFDVEKSKIILDFICSVNNIEGNYDMKGRVLVLPIEGKGQLHVVLRSLEIHVEMDITEKTNTDGKDYWHVKSWRHSFDLKEKSDIVFENLYNGNKVLDQAVQELIATSSNEIIKEVGWPMIKLSVAKVVRNINNFFKSVPVEDLTLK